MSNNRGFTFIELLITLAVIAIAFMPLMRMFTVSLEQVREVSDIATARYLAQEGMEKTKNLGFTQRQFEALGNVWEPELNSSPLLLNGRSWRIERKVSRGTDPLQIRVLVYQVGNKPNKMQGNKPLAEVTTMVEDLDWSSAV